MFDPALLGPFGLTIAALTTVIILWRFNVQQLNARLKEKDQQNAYTETLRLEERKARIEAEARLDRALNVSEEAATLASKYEALVRERVK